MGPKLTDLEGFLGHASFTGVSLYRSQALLALALGRGRPAGRYQEVPVELQPVGLAGYKALFLVELDP